MVDSGIEIAAFQAQSIDETLHVFTAERTSHDKSAVDVHDDALLW